MDGLPSARSRPLVVAFGEALYDCFPDKVVLGGAPINFAVHLQQLLGEPAGQVAVVSGIGEDALGRQLIDQVSSRHVSTAFVQTIADRATGQVQVTFNSAGEPAYYIAENAAWDFVDSSADARQLAEACRAVYFGTLSQRHPQSRAAIQHLVTATKGIRVLDVNLRPPHIDPTIIDSSLLLADVVKLNEEELLRIAAMLPWRLGGHHSVDQVAARLLQAYDLQLVALTRGSRGTVFYAADGRIEGRPLAAPRPAEDADSVGAGDACCAGLVYGLLMNWPLSQTLELANHLGAFVSSQPGGTPTLSGEVMALVHAYGDGKPDSQIVKHSCQG